VIIQAPGISARSTTNVTSRKAGINLRAAVEALLSRAAAVGRTGSFKVTLPGFSAAIVQGVE
jgi:molybdopterin biosynthesis enzyme MoaB